MGCDLTKFNRVAMPKCFRRYYGTKVTSFEIFIEQPYNLKARALTWFNYNHHNVKKLIGIRAEMDGKFTIQIS